MTANPASLWTLDELSARVALALAEGYAGQANGQVRDVPDRRTIRYYTTLGLVDRPALLRGRTALYGRRHLLQIVAVKRLQARGHSLAEVQQKLLGQTNSVLQRWAQLPAGGDAAEPPPAPAGEPSERGSFWTEPPAPVVGETDPEEGPGPAPAGRNPEEPQAPAPPAALPLQGVPLAEGATLLVAAARSLDELDIEAIRTVAAPLLTLLHKRRLLRPSAERKTP
jgi:DNA-binding transcriptional MerR regulator